MFGSGQVSGTAVTPSAGGSGGAAGQGAANSDAIDYSTTSDDQILDLGADDADEGADGAADEGDGGAGDQDQGADENDEINLDGDEEGDEADDENDGQGQDDEEEQQVDDEDADSQGQPRTPDPKDDPPALKALFKSHPELRNAYYSERAYREVMPTVNEAREYKKLAPTVEDLQGKVSKASAMDNFDSMFYANDPAKKAEMVKAMHSDDPEAFSQFAGEFSRAVHTVNPELYNSAIAEPIVISTLRNMYQRAMSEGMEDGKPGKNLAAAVEVLARRIFGVAVAELDKRQPAQASRPDPERQRFDAERTQFQEQKYSDFYQGTNEAVVKDVISAIETQVKTALKGTGFANNANAIKRIVKEAYAQTDTTLRANKGLTDLLRQELMNAKRTGNYSPAIKAKIHSLMVSKAKVIIPKATAKVVTEWTKDLLGANRRQVNTAKKSATKVDVSSGAAAARGTRNTPSGTGKVTAKDIDFSRTSDDDILNGKAFRRKT